MTDFTIHNAETAPEAAQEVLNQVKGKYGFVPNMLGIMAEAPGLLKGYLKLNELFEGGTLNATEQQIVLLTTSYENNCEYCMGVHTAIAGMQKVPGDVVTALRNGAPISDQKLQALRQLVTSMVANRGYPEQQSLQLFYGAGYTQAQLLEVILGVSMKTLSNYTNHNTETPLDDAFSAAAWQHPNN